MIIDIEKLLNGSEEYTSYMMFRNIEDWCYDNLCLGTWRFDYLCTVTVFGVDLPKRLIFDKNVDATLFKLTFNF